MRKALAVLALGAMAGFLAGPLSAQEGKPAEKKAPCGKKPQQVFDDLYKEGKKPNWNTINDHFKKNHDGAPCHCECSKKGEGEGEKKPPAPGAGGPKPPPPPGGEKGPKPPGSD